MEFTKKIMISNRVTVPVELVEAYDIKPGDLIIFDLKRVIKK